MKLRYPALAASVALMSAGASAADIRFSGFGTVNATYNSFNSQYMELREGLTTDGSKFGFLLNTKFNDRLTFSSQLLNKQTPVGRQTDFRWANLAYKLDSNFTAKIGRMPLTDRAIGDINYSNIWNNEPGEYFYQLVVRSFDGVQLAYEKSFKGGYRFEVELNAGEADADVKFDAFVPGVQVNVAGKNTYALMTTLRTSNSKTMLSIATGDLDVSIGDSSQEKILMAVNNGMELDPSLLPNEISKVDNLYLSYQRDIGYDWAFYGGITYASTDHPAFTTQFGYFGSLTRHFDEFSLHYTYAAQREELKGGIGWVDSQSSHKLGLTYNFSDNSNLRFETTYVDNEIQANDNFVMRIQPQSGMVSSVAYNFIF